jgi:ribosome maturation factor RimP
MSFLNEAEPLWTYLSEVLRDRGFALFDARRRTTSALDLTVLPLEVTPEHRSVSIDECVKICRDLRTLLLVDGEKFGISGEDAELDVSSPGVNRTLRLKSHFEGAVGERVKLVVDSSEHDSKGEAQRVLIGKLTSFEDDFVEMLEEKKKNVGVKRGPKKPRPETSAAIAEVDPSCLQRIPFERVRKANVEFDFSNV